MELRSVESADEGPDLPRPGPSSNYDRSAGRVGKPCTWMYAVRVQNRFPCKWAAIYVPFLPCGGFAEPADPAITAQNDDFS